MTEIQPSVVSGEPLASGRLLGTGSKVHDRLAFALLIFLAIVPIPVGSNRPVFWGLSAIVLALITLVYATTMASRRKPLRYPLRRLRIPFILAGIIGVWLILQVLPIGNLIGPFTTGTPSGPIASNTISVAPGQTALMLLQLASYAVFGFLMLQVAVNGRRARWMTRGLFYVVTAHAAYGLLALTQLGDPLLFFEKWAYQGSATATFINRNSYATFLAFGVAVGASLLLRDVTALVRPSRYAESGGRSSWADPAIDAVCLAFVVAALFASQSRLGTFAAGAGVLTIIAIFVARTGRGLGRWFVLAVIVAGIAIASLVAAYGLGLVERLGSLERDADVRGELYRQVIEMIAARPLTGWGGGSFELAYQAFHRPPVSPDLIWDKAHSTYLALWAELGVIVGTLPLLLVGLCAVVTAGRALTAKRSWAIPAAALAVIVVAAIHSIADFSLEIQANAFMFVALLAVGVAASANAREEVEAQEAGSPTPKDDPRRHEGT